MSGLLAGVIAAFTLSARDATAAGKAADPTYGRVDGDLCIVFGAGGVVAPGGPRAEAELRLRYLETAGLYAAYEDAEVFGVTGEPKRLLATGLELRPLFLFRWLRGYETRRARPDLLVDSLGLQLATWFEQPSGGGFASRNGFEVGLSVELPLLEGAAGPWIGVRGALRWSEVAITSGMTDSADDRQAVLAVTLAWHQIFSAHLVDAGDRAPR
jgi:hypothetical protein